MIIIMNNFNSLAVSINIANNDTIGFNNPTLGLNATNFGINNTSYKRKRSYSKKVEVPPPPKKSKELFLGDFEARS